MAAVGSRIYVSVPAKGEVWVLEDGAVVSRITGLQEPRGLTVGQEGTLHVADRAAQAVVSFSAAGVGLPVSRPTSSLYRAFASGP